MGSDEGGGRRGKKGEHSLSSQKSVVGQLLRQKRIVLNSREDKEMTEKNKEDEGFIQERLNRIFGSGDQMKENDTAEVIYVLRQSSDHSLLILDTRLQRQKTKGRFIFENSWTKEQTSETLVQEAWSKPVICSRMFQVTHKLKDCKFKFIQQRKEQNKNEGLEIEMIQKEMESMQLLEGERGQTKWRQLKTHLQVVYKVEEEYRQKKSRIRWLREWDRNSKYFHVATAERRKRNKLEMLKTENGECREE